MELFWLFGACYAQERVEKLTWTLEYGFPFWWSQLYNKTLYSVKVLFKHYSSVDLKYENSLGSISLEINEGIIHGLRFPGFDAYRGVPYGSAERFEMAQPTGYLNDINATDFGPTCMQVPWFSTQKLLDPEMTTARARAQSRFWEHFREHFREPTFEIIFFL